MRSPYRRRWLGPLRDRAVGALVLGIVRALRWLPPALVIDAGGRVARLLSPILPANGIARENIAAAFPERSASERRAILRGSWENLGRTAMEFLFLDHVATYEIGMDTGAAIEAGDALSLLTALRERSGPVLLFSAHLANWELLAVLAERIGFDMAVLYRPLNNPTLGARIDTARGAGMGRRIGSSFGAASELTGVLEGGGALGLLIDQRYGRGPLVPFLGRPARTSPTLGRLARGFDCPVYGVRAIRLDGRRFRLDYVGPLDLPRDAEGLVDVDRATATVTAIVESWIREHPDQWLWQHRRWRL